MYWFELFIILAVSNNTYIARREGGMNAPTVCVIRVQSRTLSSMSMLSSYTVLSTDKGYPFSGFDPSSNYLKCQIDQSRPESTSRRISILKQYLSQRSFISRISEYPRSSSHHDGSSDDEYQNLNRIFVILM